MNDTLARPLRRIRDRLVVPLDQRLSATAERVRGLSRRLGAMEVAVENIARKLADLSERATAATERAAATTAAEQARRSEQDARIAAQTEAVTRLAKHLDLAIEAVRAQSDRLRKLEDPAPAWASRDSLLAVEALAIGQLEPPRATADGLLVSVVMATHQRAAMIGNAIASVLAQTHSSWELLLIDDGSTDGTKEVVASFLADPRIHYAWRPHRGAAEARNEALGLAKGELIAYLDSDNVWLPGFLAGMVAAFEREPDRQSAYGILIRDRPPPSEGRILFEAFDLRALKEANYIDLNVFVHRRAPFERLGGFDTSLTRLMDWDLILRYAGASEPAAVPVAAAHYRTSAPSRITNDEPAGPSWWRIRRKIDAGRRSQTTLRVLYASPRDPRGNETSVETEIRAMRRLGVHVEVWAPAGTTLHRGSLSEALERLRPDVVHTHCPSTALDIEPEVAARGLPLTVRAHGFELSDEAIRALLDRPCIRRLHLDAHRARGLDRSDPRIAVIRSAFDTTRFAPVLQKDRRLVVRASSAVAANRLDSFLQLAKRLPEHRFVLAVLASGAGDPAVERLLELRAEIDSPAEILVNLPHEEVASLMGRAGIYLHTLAAPGEPDAMPVGQPISIAEAMASGCHVLVRDLPPLRDYVGQAGGAYRDLDEAARRIEETARWTDADWRGAAHRAIDRAWMRHADDLVLRPLYASWLEIAG